ncbi:ATP-binding protein [Actinoplanes sp. NPDC023714]|uniref:ATP-binding protein n=1 Tax=Actinoplanes sp. NPDC023714 TaxID=3154322 RepID=UPI0033D03675
MSEHTLVDIQPTPNVLLALTRTPITPLDALCELIDNAIDSFRAAELEGIKVPFRQVFIDLPGASEVNRNGGLVRVRDTGLGLTEKQIADALRAGYSSKNAFDTLGLFGMGFNIATGKLGRVTKLISARQEDNFALEVVVNLPKLIEQGTFEVPARQIPKPMGLERGTIVEIRDWWPAGDPNNAFIRKLATMPKALVRSQLARRYATLIRGEDGPPARISVNNESDDAFEHCVWDATRFVERSGYGRIPARIEFNEELATSSRCLRDGTLMDGPGPCPRCGGSDVREISERVWGWVGIQRYDDQNDFGIDLIRNGRAIRVSEKNAFFEYTDENTKRPDREYPVDQQYGRIVGEVHLDHVPVDFSKQDFQRTSDEWHNAMAFLRGESLLPSKWPAGQKNESPVSRLFQGYRKVRNFGLSDMYMGRYNPSRQKAERIPREVEKEYLAKFQARETGFYDDAEWWKLVETASDKPIEELPECPECGYQNAASAEQCEGCDYVLRAKACISDDCEAELPISAVQCPECGASQVPTIVEPWSCTFCAKVNEGDDAACARCSHPRGTAHPADPDSLDADSTADEGLSVTGLELNLARGGPSAPLDISVRTVRRSIIPSHGADPIPLVVRKLPRSLTVYVDMTHAGFADLGMRVEDAIAAEVAHFVYESNANLAGTRGHSTASLMAQVLQKAWPERVTEAPDSVRSDIERLFSLIADRIGSLEEAGDFYTELTVDEQRRLLDNMLSSGVELGKINDVLKSGDYLRYADLPVLVRFYDRYPHLWFDGRVWEDAWPTDDLGAAVVEAVRQEIKDKYLRCMQDCASYLRYQSPERLLVVRAKAAFDYLSGKLR